MSEPGRNQLIIPRFDRDFFGSGRPFSRIGDGAIGGKAQGLVLVHETLANEFAGELYPGCEVRIPTTVVVATDVFDAFMDRNHLHDLASSNEPDHLIAQGFQAGSLPAEFLGDLQGLINQVHSPLAIRSSSLLEDALGRPFAGVYETKMTPNNQPEPAARFRKLAEAIRFVYASTFFKAAKSYRAATGPNGDPERMAVIIQEVVGSRRWDRHYPLISAVARSYNYYATGSARPEEGIVSLALGLGKTIVDGGACWTYSPEYPTIPPPYGSVRDLLRASQNRFWSVNMGPPPAFDPLRETEFLIEGDLGDAEADGVLAQVASTFDPASDRVISGVVRPGPRILDFAPLLKRTDEKFNAIVAQLLAVCRRQLNADVEIEIAIDMDRSRQRDLFGLVQVRPMVVADQSVALTDGELQDPALVFSSHSVAGNGIEDGLRDVIYVKPASFRPGQTGSIANELAGFNARLVADGSPYVLIGFGRWGTTDPWAGIPVVWGQIAGARVVVEARLPGFRSAPSQGSHFFHNVTSLGILYFSLDEEGRDVDWAWLESLPAQDETEHLRHLRLEQPLVVKVDGKRRRGGAWKGLPSTDDAARSSVEDPGGRDGQ